MTSDYDYPLPEHLIAQHPLKDRAASRLLQLDRKTGAITHRRFSDLPDLIAPGDVLVVNASRVIPARLLGTRDNGRQAEILLVHPGADDTWLAMVHPGGKLKTGRKIRFGDEAEATIESVEGGGLRRIRFTGLGAETIMARFGSVPLPPYIHRAPDAADRERYQTVYARVDGSVAAPTAGLHFTPALLDRIARGGARVAEVILHVGPGTFKPVDVDNPAEHRIHAEWYEVPDTTAARVTDARRSGHRIWAVGTTAARTLETAGKTGVIQAGSGWTDVFIYPPFDFRIVDVLLTNFHLPRSTLVMLVAAFAGREHVMAAYREAVNREYRFYSYGDAMLVV